MLMSTVMSVICNGGNDVDDSIVGDDDDDCGGVADHGMS